MSEETAPTFANLKSEDFETQVKTLWLFSQRKQKDPEAEKEIASLLVPSQRGRWLARWSYHALNAVSENPEKYMNSFWKAALWKPGRDGNNNQPARPPIATSDGDIIGIGGHGVAPASEPKLPEDILAHSDAAWATSC